MLFASRLTGKFGSLQFKWVSFSGSCSLKPSINNMLDSKNKVLIGKSSVGVDKLVIAHPQVNAQMSLAWLANRLTG